jgi:Flp pilus assembly protein TadG
MKIRALRGDSKGQALLEFALILPVLLLLVLGIVEFGRVWNLAQLMSDTAREGTRRAVIADATITEQSVKDFMAGKLESGGVPVSAITITFSQTGATWHTGANQVGTITIPYRFMFFSRLFGPVNLVSSFTMRME